MKADGPILAEGERAPGWWARYRFYAAAKIPKGYEDWALRRLSPPRWIAFYLVFDLAAWIALIVATVVVTGRVDFPWPVWFVWVFAALLAPLRARQRRKQIVRSLAPPPAGEILKQIGEPSRP